MILPSSRMPQLCTACVMVKVTPPAFCEPPLFIGRVFATPLDSSQWQVSKIPTTAGEHSFARGTASPRVLFPAALVHRARIRHALGFEPMASLEDPHHGR